MIEKTEAVVLRFVPVTNTSRVVTWLTRDFGRITSIIKGSQRPKSFFLGQYDLFYTCEVVFYTRDHHRLSVTRECYPIKRRDRFRRDWKAVSAASYLADLAYRIAPPGAPDPTLYSLLDHGLDDLAEAGATPSALFWFELKLLEQHGLAPRLHQCLDCGQPLVSRDRRARFSYARGGILCGACADGEHEHSHPIAPDILATLSAWQRASHADIVRRTRSTERQLSQVQELLGLFISFHLDVPLTSRSIALDTLSRKVA